MNAVVFYGDGMVWDAEKHDVLCQFVDGKYETNDAREIRLLSASYKHSIIEALKPETRARKVKNG